MTEPGKHIVDRFGRKHDYLRISLTERCNMRCFYCMPEEGVLLQEKEKYMSADEIFKMANLFVNLGVKKIRLTGGEPLVRKDTPEILRRLSNLPVELALTSNGILLDQYIELFEELGINKINVSLDSLDAEKNLIITKRDAYDRVRKNIQLLLNRGIVPKLNMVLIRGINDNEIIDFIELTQNSPLDVRFIEFMPFNGNHWEKEKCVDHDEVMGLVEAHYGAENIKVIRPGANFIARDYAIENYRGTFGLISTVTKPFCEQCNRIRLTADGKMKNCLFSAGETDLLGPLRRGEDIVPLIMDCILEKKEKTAGMDFLDEEVASFGDQNRSMIRIGG